jgi:hypothetical protein
MIARGSCRAGNAQRACRELVTIVSAFCPAFDLLREKGIIPASDERDPCQSALKMLNVNNHNPLTFVVYAMMR